MVLTRVYEMEKKNANHLSSVRFWCNMLKYNALGADR